ncbi:MULTISPECIES: aldo/keto reductase [Paraburkholderia]|uniref:aldo/keto reductase n=1 Tax=Paraburkholderia TaxID=1822464 RepID=UPI00036CAFE4|nr:MULTISPECIES: aldo/keto reductase [Paraburkholderia]MDH6148628.1 aryl-alcohol dehydrogenase-like predicted oxidoreductase [Paraburkholderia sp. WSM4179]
MTVAQLAIAWAAAQGADVVPLVGARTRARLAEALGSVSLPLTDDDLLEIERVIPKGAAAGERYASTLLAELDSEKRPSER